MATGSMSEVLLHLGRAVLLRDGAGLTDGQLLEDFLSRRDEAAVAALVRRHGPMVWNVCRRVLGSHHDAEDAFQATFLVLVRKAASITPRERVANWLYGVAHQTALKARATAARRKAREKQVAPMPEPAALDNELWGDLQEVLDQELSRLPSTYRAVIILCDLEGHPRKAVARQLGLPEGTVASRLARARTMLAKRLTRRGVALSAGALAVVLSQKVAAAIPAAVASSTIQAVSPFASGQAAGAGVISVKAASLTQGVLRAMLLSKIKMVTAVLFAVATVVGAGGVIYSTQTTEPVRVRHAAGPNQAKPNKQGKQDRAKRPQETFEDFAQFQYGGGGVSATGIRGKGGFTVAPLKAVAGCSKLSVSLAVKEETQLTASDFRIVAVDAAGKRHQASAASGVSAGGNGITVITVVPEFNLSSDKIDALVIQQRKGKK